MYEIKLITRKLGKSMRDWKELIYKEKSILFVANDSGGAFILSAIVQNWPHFSSSCVSGPAKKIFNEQGISNFVDIPNLKTFDIVITGSSTESCLELEMIERATREGIRTVSFIDNWSNYSNRFTRGNHSVLPKEIWTGDEHAFNLATNTFPKTIIHQVYNPYWQSIISEIKRLYSESNSIHRTGNIHLLYLIEPLSQFETQKIEKAFQIQVDEMRIFSDFCSEIECLYNSGELSSIEKITIKVRPHPSKIFDLCEVQSESRLFHERTIQSNASLAEDISWSNLVIGSNSSALAIASLLGIPTLSFRPYGITRHLPLKFGVDFSQSDFKVILSE